MVYNGDDHPHKKENAMEAVTAIIRNLLKNMKVVLVLGVVLGLLLGLIIGWGLWPVTWASTTPELLESTVQMKAVNPQAATDLAEDRWDWLDEAAQPAFARVAANPGYLDQASVQDFRLAIESRKGPLNPTETPAPSATSQYVWIIAVVLILAVFAAAGLYLWRLLRKGPSMMTPGMQAAAVNRGAERTDFEALGVAKPITHMMTTYLLGDDLYDESFSIDADTGEFLGEYGASISETIGVGEPKKATALEVWLFDKNDINTATKVLMSEHAFGDPNIRARLEAKGDLVEVKPGDQILLETKTLQLLAKVVDMNYGTGPLPPKSYFDRVTLELAIWPRQEGSK
jgi:hypothetical protein